MVLSRRIETIQKKLSEKEGSAFVIISPFNRRYLTDIKTSSGYIIITPENGFFFTDSRYIEFAKKSLGAYYTVEPYPKTPEAKKYYTELLQKENIKNILYEENSIYLKTKKHFDDIFSEFALLESGGLVEKMREVKDESEIENIKKAQNITDTAFSYILNVISQNANTITESDIAAELEYFMKKNGAEAAAFDIIAVSGKKSSYPHGQPEHIKLSKGFLTMDFGALYNGYCSDMTRTVCLGRPTEKMQEVYGTVKSAQCAALEMIKADIAAVEVDRAVRGIIKNAGYGDNFGHGAGHSLGLEIHESPGFPKSEEEQKEEIILSENMVMTMEPGIYLEGEFGVRIEDLVVVKQGGCLNLTKSAKELIVI